MKCDDFVAIIEEYIDGELDEREAGPVRTHLNGCAGCASVYQSLKQEQLIYARYSRDLDVGPAMWAAVEARIKQEPAAQAAPPGRSLREILAGLFATPRLSFAFTVALVLIAVGVTIAVMSYMQSGGNTNRERIAEAEKQPETPPPAPEQKPVQPPTLEEKNITPKAPVVANTTRPKPRAVKPPPSPEQLVREAEEKYLSAIAILTRDVNRQRSKLEPHVLAKFENALASINRTIDETRVAARKNPDDPIALQYMLAAYSKKVELLREMARN